MAMASTSKILNTHFTEDERRMVGGTFYFPLANASYSSDQICRKFTCMDAARDRLYREGVREFTDKLYKWGSD